MRLLFAASVVAQASSWTENLGPSLLRHSNFPVHLPSFFSRSHCNPWDASLLRSNVLWKKVTLIALHGSDGETSLANRCPSLFALLTPVFDCLICFLHCCMRLGSGEYDKDEYPIRQWPLCERQIGEGVGANLSEPFPLPFPVHPPETHQRTFYEQASTAFTPSCTCHHRHCLGIRRFDGRPRVTMCPLLWNTRVLPSLFVQSIIHSNSLPFCRYGFLQNVTLNRLCEHSLTCKSCLVSLCVPMLISLCGSSVGLFRVSIEFGATVGVDLVGEY